MRLFVFSLLLAVAVVLLSAFLFDVNVGLRQHLVWVLSTTIGGFAFIGLIVAVMEERRNRLRQQKRQSYLKSPSRTLRTIPPAPMGPASSASIPKPSISFEDSAPAASHAAAPPPEETEAQEALVSASLTPDNGISTQSATAFQAADQQAAEDAQPDAPATDEISSDAALADALDEAAAEVRQAEAAEAAAEADADQAAAEARTPADQVLYLARDFEFSEVKRVLNLWQMAYDEATPGEILGRWISEDGTLVEVLNDKDGTPIIEIRGPMADELAEFLPQDLPVYPGEHGPELV